MSQNLDSTFNRLTNNRTINNRTISVKNNNDLTACVVEHLLTRLGYLSISGQTIITVKDLIRVNLDGSCYISLVFPLKITKINKMCSHFFVAIVKILIILFDKTCYFIRNGNSDQSKTKATACVGMLPLYY